MNAAFGRKFTKTIRQAPHELHRIAGQGYPSFVTAVRPRPIRDHVPVFMFHAVNRPNFAAQLAFLAHNGYQTLTLPQFIAFLDGSFEPKRPSILLTFDDGDASWYDIAYPLLQQHKFHAIGFIVTAFIREQPQRTGGHDWLSWPELRDMQQSSIFDFHAHGHTHAKIFIEPTLTSFYSPEFDHNALNLNVPWLPLDGVETNDLPWGTPLFHSAPLLEGQRRLCVDPDINRDMAVWVRRQGGAAFFQRDTWRQQLDAHYNAVGGPQQTVHFHSATERLTAISAELRTAKITLENQLDKSVTHFCYPFGRGSEIATTISRDCGYESNFWTTRADRVFNRAGDSPFAAVRLKDDYLLRLPGSGRAPLWRIFGRKLNRRLRSTDIYYAP